MTPSFKRFLIALGVLSGLAASLRIVAAPLLLAYLSWTPPSCPQPCADLGEKPFTVFDEILKSTETVYRPTCPPLSLTLELARPSAKVGKRALVWYKVKIRNQCCLTLTTSLDHIYFPAYSNSLSIDVLDPDGREVQSEEDEPDNLFGKPGEPFKPMPYMVPYGSIHRYKMDLTGLNQLRAQKRVSPEGDIELAPGEELVTQGTLLDPYREVMVEMKGQDGGMGSGTGRISVPTPPGTEIPPKGFSPRGDFIFRRPGRYSVVASYKHSQGIQPIFPRVDALPRRIRRILHWIDYFMDIDVTPEDPFRILEHNAVSNKVEFEVSP